MAAVVLSDLIICLIISSGALSEGPEESDRYQEAKAKLIWLVEFDCLMEVPVKKTSQSRCYVKGEAEAVCMCEHDWSNVTLAFDFIRKFSTIYANCSALHVLECVCASVCTLKYVYVSVCDTMAPRRIHFSPQKYMFPLLPELGQEWSDSCYTARKVVHVCVCIKVCVHGCEREWGKRRENVPVNACVCVCACVQALGPVHWRESV